MNLYISVMFAVFFAFALGLFFGIGIAREVYRDRPRRREMLKQLAPLVDDITFKNKLMRGDPGALARAELQRLNRDAAAAATPKQWQGCPRCYGSGGPRRNPCHLCKGTGKLDIATGLPFEAGAFARHCKEKTHF